MSLSPAKLRQYRWRTRIAIVGLLLPLILLASHWPDYRQMIASRNWPAAHGVITGSQLKPGYVRASFGSNRKVIAGYYTEVRYRYMVNGKEFTGQQISFDPSLHSEAAARRDLEVYSIGKSVPVYYNPAAPAVAVLKPGIRREQQSTLFLGIILFLGFALSFCFLNYTLYRINKELRNCGPTLKM